MAKNSSSSFSWSPVLWFVCIAGVVIFFVAPLLAQITGAIGSFFQSVLKITGDVTHTVTAPFINIANDVAAGQAGATELKADLDMSDQTNPWSPLFFQQDGVDADFPNLSDGDSQDLVNSINQATAFLGAWQVGDQRLAVFNALQDNIGSQVELSAFCFYWQTHTGSVLVNYLTNGGILGIGFSFDNTTWDPVSKWARALAMS